MPRTEVHSARRLLRILAVTVTASINSLPNPSHEVDPRRRTPTLRASLISIVRVDRSSWLKAAEEFDSGPSTRRRYSQTKTELSS